MVYCMSKLIDRLQALNRSANGRPARIATGRLSAPHSASSLPIAFAPLHPRPRRTARDAGRLNLRRLAAK